MMGQEPTSAVSLECWIAEAMPRPTLSLMPPLIGDEAFPVHPEGRASWSLHLTYMQATAFHTQMLISHTPPHAHSTHSGPCRAGIHSELNRKN